MTPSIRAGLVEAGIRTVFAYPGYPADEVLADVDGDAELRLIVTVGEASIVSAAHAHWMVTGDPAAIVVCDGAGIESALPMLALAVREAVGLVVIVPGLLHGESRTTTMLESLGVGTFDLRNWDPLAVAESAREGRVVAAVPEAATHPRRSESPNPPTRRMSASHNALVIGPTARPDELDLARRHTCPVITTGGVRPALDIRSRWLGPLVLGSPRELFAALGLGSTRPSTVAAIGCPPMLESWLTTFGAQVSVATLDNAGVCGEPSPLIADDPAEPLPLLDALTAVAGSLPGAVLISDAGASHKVSARAARNLASPLVSTLGPTTMGWGPGAALGAALAADAPVVLSIGDGSLAMSGLQLLDWQRHGVRGVVVVAGNGVLGSVQSRLGDSHPAITACPLRPEALLEAVQIPWRQVRRGEDPALAAAWAADVAVSGAVSALVVDTTGHHEAKYRLAAGLPWWDAVTHRSTS